MSLLKIKSLFIIWVLVFSSALVFADADCSGKKQYSEPDCLNAAGTATECGSSDTCEPDFQDPVWCCANPASVPELPSWLGPFFLAMLFAGYEYLKINKRKSTEQPDFR